jgi:hypothetical protein
MPSTTNSPSARRIFEDEGFKSGQVDTNYIERALTKG